MGRWAQARRRGSSIAPPSALVNSLLVCWKFNTDPGFLVDSGPNGLTLHNDSGCLPTTGYEGNAPNFDQFNGGCGTPLTIPDEDALAFGPDRTIFFRFYLDGMKTSYLVAKHNGINNDSSFFIGWPVSDRLVFNCTNQDNAGITVVSPNELTRGVWHCAFAWTDAGNVYLQVDSDTPSGAALMSPPALHIASQLYLGAGPEGYPLSYPDGYGLIDDYAMWSKILSPTERASLVAGADPLTIT